MKRLEHVIVVSDYAQVQGGQAKVAIDTALRLREQNIAVTFVSGTGKIAPELIESGARVVCVGDATLIDASDRLSAMARGIWNRSAAASVRAILGAADPQTTIIHWHGFAKALSPSVGEAIVQSDVPHVYTMHEYFLACPNGGFYDYQRGEICYRRALSPSCIATNCDSRSPAYKAWRIARQLALRDVARVPAKLKDVIYLTDKQLDVMRPYLSPSARLHKLSSVVEGHRGERVAAEKNDIFLFLGRLSPEKGPLLVAEAAKRAGVRVAFAGVGEMAEAVRAANPEAEILGWIEGDAKEALIRRSRCLLFPSLWYETQGLSVIELMQWGVPSLVSATSVASDAVRHRIDGVHVPADVDSWVAAIELMKDDAVVEWLSRSAYEAQNKPVATTSYTDDLVAVYNEARAGQLAEAQL